MKRLRYELAASVGGVVMDSLFGTLEYEVEGASTLRRPAWR